jgi:predicted nucleotidyltransferase
MANVSTSNANIDVMMMNWLEHGIRKHVEEKKEMLLKQIADEVKEVYEQETAKLGVQLARMVKIHTFEDHIVLTIYKKGFRSPPAGKGMTWKQTYRKSWTRWLGPVNSTLPETR